MEGKKEGRKEGRKKNEGTTGWMNERKKDRIKKKNPDFMFFELMFRDNF